ncbi:MAG TPA: FIST N-terminal domain-containing protein [Polyangia bacterium]
MLRAGSGFAVTDDGSAAGRMATQLALKAAALPSAQLAMVFAGARHGSDEFRAVLAAVRETSGAAAVMGCSTTGIITMANEIENHSAVAVLLFGGDEAIPLLVATPVRAEPRDAGLRLGKAARARLGYDSDGATLVVLVDPHHLDASAFVAGIAEGAPGLMVVGAGASGREDGDARVFTDGKALPDAAVAFLIPGRLFPTVGMTHGCQGVCDPLPITAVEQNVILEIDGRPAADVLKEVLALPGNRPLEKLSIPLLAGIGDRMCDERSDYVVRPFVVSDDDPRTLAVPEPVRTGQTIRFTLRDAIGARDDMKAMLDEQSHLRAKSPPAFGLYFNCAGRGSALYGKSGLDPDLIQRRFGNMPLVGIESAFEIAPTCGRPQVHMLTGVLLLAGAGADGKSAAL